MTVPAINITTGPYAGNGVASVFAYDFRIDEAAELAVYQTDAEGVVTLLVLDTDYSVSGAGEESGGNVTRLAGALPSGYQWLIRSNVQPLQETEFASQGGFYPDVHEQAFDKLTRLVQQLGDGVERSVRLPESETGDMVLPPVAQRAGKLLTFGGTGLPEMATNPISLGEFTGTVAENYAALRLVAISGLAANTPVLVVNRATAGDGGGGVFRWDTSDLSAQVATDTQSGIYVAPSEDMTGESGAWVRMISGPAFDIRWFGGDISGGSPSDDALEGAITMSLTLGGGYVFMPRGVLRINSTITYARRTISIRGVRAGAWNPTGNGLTEQLGSQIKFYGSGDLFTSADPGAGDYNGYQSFDMEDVLLTHAAPDTALNNGYGSYKLNSAGIRDIKGGDVSLTRCGFSNFHYGTHGLHSDINRQRYNVYAYCKKGIYQSSRSDQLANYDPYFFYCDTAVDLDQPQQPTFYSPVFVNCGSPSDYAVDIREGCRGATFVNPWVETTGNNVGLKAQFGIGMTSGTVFPDSAQSRGIRIVNPTIFNTTVGGPGSIDHLCECGRVNDLVISDPTWYGALVNLEALCHLTNNDATINIRFGDSSFATRLYSIAEGINPTAISADSTQGHLFHYGGRIYSKQIPSNPKRDFFLSAEVDKRLVFSFQDAGEDWTEFVRFGKKVLHGYVTSSTPIDFWTWDQGDHLTHTDASPGGFMGRVCTEGGTNGTYSEGRTATADGTTTVVLSAASAVLKVGMYLTINSVTRTVVSISGTTMVMSDTVPAGTELAIAYRAPTFKTYGAISA